MPSPTHVHWLRGYDVLTRWGEMYCGFRGVYRAQGRYLVFGAFGNRGVDRLDATTAFCEVTCSRCARYRLSCTEVEVKKHRQQPESAAASVTW